MTGICGLTECTTSLPHHTHTDADGRSWCCQDESPYDREPDPFAVGSRVDVFPE